MISFTILLGLTAVIGFVAIGGSVFQLVKTLGAQRAWERAMATHADARTRLVEDIAKEAALLAREGPRRLGETYLDRALSDVVDQLVSEHALTEEERRYILAGLHQPSVVGRRRYAKKLARTAGAGSLAAC